MTDTESRGVQDLTDPSSPRTPPDRRVLNAGSGPPSARRLHPAFRREDWAEVRIDISPEAEPDVLGSITDMTEVFASQSFDAVWSSHVLEHLFAHQVPLALSEFKRVLKPDGFALITSPDLEFAAALVLRHGPDHVAYVSPAGPITVHDLLFGHTPSIERGKVSMAHNTGFTCSSLGRLLVEAGFSSVLAKLDQFDLWAVALMDRADEGAVQEQLQSAGLDMFDEAAEGELSEHDA